MEFVSSRFFFLRPATRYSGIEFRKNVLLFRHSLHDTLPTDVWSPIRTSELIGFRLLLPANLEKAADR